MMRRFTTGFFMTDDEEAIRLAQEHHIVAVTTWDLLRLTARATILDRDTLWGYDQTLRTQHRGAPPGVRDRPSFDIWVTGQR